VCALFKSAEDVKFSSSYIIYEIQFKSNIFIQYFNYSILVQYYLRYGRSNNTEYLRKRQNLFVKTCHILYVLYVAAGLRIRANYIAFSPILLRITNEHIDVREYEMGSNGNIKCVSKQLILGINIHCLKFFVLL